MTTSNLGTDTNALFRHVAEAAKTGTPQAPPNVLQVWRTVFARVAHMENCQAAGQAGAARRDRKTEGPIFSYSEYP
jgi:hypothetical protein